MKFGCCLGLGQHPSVGAKEDPSFEDKLGWLAENIRHLADTGYDFVELALARTAGALDDTDYGRLIDAVNKGGIPSEAFNIFLPGSIKVTGPEFNMEAIKEYLALAMPRAHQLGCKTIVFGSGGSRQIPEGFPRETAENQLEDFLKVAGDAAARESIVIVIEPLNSKDSNIFTSVSEAARFARRVGHPNIKVLADFYHMDEDNESFDGILEAGYLLFHVHLADTGRMYPGSGSYDYDGFFGALKAVSYDQRLSLECGFTDFRKDTVAALQFMKDKWSRTGG